MDEQRTVQQAMIPVQDIIDKDESVRMARRRFESESTRSLIVVDGDQPLGVLEWRHIMHMDPAIDDLPVREVMAPTVAELTVGMKLDEAVRRLNDVDLSTIPVVDDSGRLIGEVPRSALVHQERVIRDEPVVEPVPPDSADGLAVSDLAKGMTVVGSSESKIGSLSDMVIDSTGQLDAIIVSHGLFGRKKKRVNVDLVERVDHESIVLRIDGPEFNALPDAGEVSERV